MSAWGARLLRLGAAGLLLLAAACSDGTGGKDGQPAAAETLASARQAGTIRIGFADEAPFGYLDSAKNRVTGEAPEIARLVMARLGVTKVEGVLTEFGSLIPGLEAGRFDIIAAGMYILPERCKRIDFSNPTYGIGQAFIVARGNPAGLHSYADVVGKTDATLGVVAGAVERSYAQELGIPDDRVVIFPSAANALAGVQAGRVSAFAGTALTIQDLLSKLGDDADVERADPFEQPLIGGKPVVGYGGFGFRKSDTALRAAFDKELAGVIGSEEHRKLVAPFGFTPKELPGGKTAAQLCAG